MVDKMGMTIVNPLASANLVVQSAAATNRPEERQLDLRMEQIVRATVVEGGLDKVLLEMNQQRFQIVSERELQTGQQLELQVLATEPKLIFKILSQPIESRMATLLPLLSKPFDWSALLQRLSQTAIVQGSSSPPPSQVAQNAIVTMPQVIEQLGQLLQPPAELSARGLTELVVALGQLRRAEPLFATPNGPQLAAAFDQVLQTVSARLEGLDLPQQLQVMAEQIRSEPELLQSFLTHERGRVEQLLQRFEPQQQELAPRQARQLAGELKALLIRSPETMPQRLALMGQELGQLLRVPEGQSLIQTPKLLGQLQVLIEQLKIADNSRPNWPVDLQQAVSRVLLTTQPLMEEPQLFARGEKLGILSQLLGLNLEAELLRGRTREALSSLKLALLGERQQLGSEGEDALHRLELFQVCRSRFAESNQLFFPLPFPFLEEGFLLVDDDGQAEDPDRQNSKRRFSLYLRLSALGNVRVDMLQEASGLLLRIACEDQERASFLESLGDQLRERLQGGRIKGVNFTLGARAPARELIEKLVPRTKGMLDARV